MIDLNSPNLIHMTTWRQPGLELILDAKHWNQGDMAQLCLICRNLSTVGVILPLFGSYSAIPIIYEYILFLSDHHAFDNNPQPLDAFNISIWAPLASQLLDSLFYFIFFNCWHIWYISGCLCIFPSAHWHCRLGNRKGIRAVKY